MLEILDLSGESLAVLELSDEESVKEQLQETLGWPRFRLRLVGELQSGCVRLVILNFCPPDAEHDEAFLSRCEEGASEEVEKMLRRPQDLDTANAAGATGLHKAAEHGQEEVAKLLLSARADVESAFEGATALHIASWQGHEAVARVLLEGKACVDARDSQGFNALHWAVSYGESGVALVLVDAKADVTAPDAQGGRPCTGVLPWA